MNFTIVDGCDSYCYRDSTFIVSTLTVTIVIVRVLLYVFWILITMIDLLLQ